MTPPDAKPRRPRRRFLVPALALLVLAAGTWYVVSRGGWVNVLRLPPVLDASTPRSQFGYTLAEVRRADVQANDDSSDRSAIYLFVRPPSFPKCWQEGRSDSEFYAYSFNGTTPIIQATATTSNGDITPLLWKIVGDANTPQFLRLEIPGGYSDACRSLDITLVPNSGPFPHWRITRLPPMRRVIPDSPQITDSVAANGITTTASAWRSRHIIFLQIRPNLPANSHQWELVINDKWSEWEKFSQPHQPLPQNIYPIQSRNGVLTELDKSPIGPLRASFPGDYRSASRYVRLSCSLRQFETLDEPVTFHNVAVQWDLQGPSGYDRTCCLSLPHPLTATTPSGVTLTLPAQGSANPPDFTGGCLNFLMTTQPPATANGTLQALPQSSLSRTFGHPVQISVALPLPYHLGSWTSESGNRPASYSVLLPAAPTWHPTRNNPSRVPVHPALPPVLKDFTVIVRQRVDIQTIPMTFTLPVEDKSPPYYPKGYQPPKRL